APKASEIVRVSRAFGGKVPLHRLAAAALNALQCAARASGIKAPLLQPTSAFRDPKRQAQLWATALKKYGSPEEARKWVAPPGSSAHQSGRAIDFYLGGKNSSANVARLRKLRAYQWLVANARRFGFYPYDREPWHWEYNPPAAQQSEWFGAMLDADGQPESERAGSKSVAMCWKPEKASHGETLYLQIDLGLGKNLACTGVYIPKSFKPDQEFTVVVYLHGHKGGYPGNSVLINGYWDSARFPFFALREEIAASRRNVILVAPSLGPKSQAGNLIQPRGFDRFMTRVLNGVNHHYSVPRSGRPIAAIQNIILAAHSGGGAPMLRIVSGKDQLAAKIKQCWCFDSMYGAVASAWIAWAKSHPNSGLFVYYGPGKGRHDPKSGKLIPYPLENAKSIACLSRNSKLANVCVQASRARRTGKVDAHFWVPKVHLNERLLNRPCTNPDLCTREKSRVQSESEFPGFAVSP
ncbi:MAG: D-alanyl-D-alanine carboxypeptidase family protein, partial [Gammaproteobacteria bacterium]